MISLNSSEKSFLKKRKLKLDYYELCNFDEFGDEVLDFEDFSILQNIISKLEEPLIQEAKNRKCKNCNKQLEVKFNSRGRVSLKTFCDGSCSDEFYESEFAKYYKYLDLEKCEKNKEIKKKCRSRIHSRLKYFLKNPNLKNKDLIFDLIGCSIKEYKEHIEKYFIFDKEMNWANYGHYWEVDHILPVDSFDLQNEIEVLEAFHFSNVRAIKIGDNRLLNTVLNKNSIYWTPYSRLKYANKLRLIELAKVRL